MASVKNHHKTVLFVFDDSSEIDCMSDAFASNECRVIKAADLKSLFESLEKFKVDLVIAEEKFRGIPLTQILPFLRTRFPELKIIIATRGYSPENELTLRPYKVLYIMPFPINIELLVSIVEKGLKLDVRSLPMASAV